MRGLGRRVADPFLARRDRHPSRRSRPCCPGGDFTARPLFSRSLSDPFALCMRPNIGWLVKACSCLILPRISPPIGASAHPIPLTGDRLRWEHGKVTAVGTEREERWLVGRAGSSCGHQRLRPLPAVDSRGSIAGLSTHSESRPYCVVASHATVLTFKAFSHLASSSKKHRPMSRCPPPICSKAIFTHHVHSQGLTSAGATARPCEAILWSIITVLRVAAERSSGESCL
jgi:hypothetical protein